MSSGKNRADGGAVPPTTNDATQESRITQHQQQQPALSSGGDHPPPVPMITTTTSPNGAKGTMMTSQTSSLSIDIANNTRNDDSNSSSLSCGIIGNNTNPLQHQPPQQQPQHHMLAGAVGAQHPHHDPHDPHHHQQHHHGMTTQHHNPDSTLPVTTPTMQPIIELTQRLLNIRGSPPGTFVSMAEHEIRLICQKVKPILLAQPMLLELEVPMKICGDIHGQYTDLLRLFEYGGFPPSANYLFLGDYVDRGKQSIETICLLLAYKIQYPENFFILRGNHEAAGINRIYGFYDECKRRYTIKLWKIFSDVFNCLPVTALIEEKILCMHGGLSPELHDLEQIAAIQRPCDVPDVGLMCDLLWSDPDPSLPLPRTNKHWNDNDRGVSYVFSCQVVTQFLEEHDLDLLVRAHQVVEDGYEFFAGRRLVTLFSAPNYCGEFDNAGGMISVDEDLMCSFQILKPQSRGSRFATNNSAASHSIDGKPLRTSGNKGSIT